MPASEVITLAGGCFWCTEAVFTELRGVASVVSGYMGGEAADPTYEQVCTGKTGHAEVIQVTFDPEQIALADLLDVFFTTHDPTTLNRQGADVGTQYRSAIFTHSDEQAAIAKQKINEWNSQGELAGQIVTEVTPAQTFYPAEDYHQNFFSLNPQQGYCRAVIPPKLAKLRQKFAEKLRTA